MSLSNYAGLKATVARWANRDDVTADVIDWIMLFEDRARRELRGWLTNTALYVNVSADLSVGDIFEEVHSVALADGVGGPYNGPLDIIDFSEYHRRMATDSSLRQPPTAVYLERDEQDNTYTLKFYPPTQGAVNQQFIRNLAITGIGTLPSLSDGQTTNRLLSAAPSLYLKGSLLEGAQFLEHDERIPVWQKEVEDGIKALNLQQERRQGARPKPVPLPVVFG